MGARRNYGSPVTRLVPVHSGGSDPSTGTNPTLVRQAITSQTVTEDGDTASQALAQTGAVGNVIEFTWALAPSYPAGDELWIGDLPLIEGRHYNGANGDSNTSASNFAAAFNALYGYLGWTVNAVANVVTVTARPRDPQIRDIRTVFRTNPQNFLIGESEVQPNDVFFGPPVIIS